MRRRKKKRVQSLAVERIKRLWILAEAVAVEHPEQARAWMYNARKIAQKARIKIPKTISRRICKRCGTVFIPGRNCRVRVRGNRAKHLSVTCLECGLVRRFYTRREG